jgi:hypothetical protein
MGGSDQVVGNVFSPDENASYWVTALPALPSGVSYRITGQFPHARYMSFTVYNGLPSDHLLDVNVRPDPGSSNPFLPHANRNTKKRSYTIPLLPQVPPANPANRQPGALYIGGGQDGTPNPVPYIIYRVYVPDNGTGDSGGTPLPNVEIVAPSGTVANKPVESLPCQATRQQIIGALQPAGGDLDGTTLPASPAPFPGASNPPTWSASTGSTARLAQVAPGVADQISGGAASNPDNVYIGTSTSRSFGQVLVVHAPAPTTPLTMAGEAKMGTGQLRYWSICQGDQGGRTVACLNDEQFKLDSDGGFTIAISAPADRPTNASNWLPWGPESDARLLYRQMLPSPSFYPVSAQAAIASGNTSQSGLQAVMGAYFPQAVYCSTARFEADRCGFGAS